MYRNQFASGMLLRMAQDKIHELLSVTTVADGNPATAMALEEQAKLAGIPLCETIELSLTSNVGNIVHRRLTSDHAKAARYTEDSDARRVGLMAKSFAFASFVEFATKARANRDSNPTRWTVVQEHQLLGAIPRVLEWLGIETIQLATPDVFPKESGIVAVKRHEQAQISVWNTVAQSALLERGVRTELDKPYFLDGFRPDQEVFLKNGREVIVKSSGSGMPEAFEKGLRTALGSLDVDWAFHTLTDRFSPGQVVSHYSKKSRISSFFDDLGGQTRLIIGYPSELVGIVCDMQSRGVPTEMITLPPRGIHEKNNLRFALDYGLVRAELSLPDNASQPTFPDMPTVTTSELAHNLSNLRTHHSSSVVATLGTKPYWQ